MAEWSNAAVLKTVIPSDRDRGFESPSLLHFVQSTNWPGVAQALEGFNPVGRGAKPG